MYPLPYVYILKHLSESFQCIKVQSSSVYTSLIWCLKKMQLARTPPGAPKFTNQFSLVCRIQFSFCPFLLISNCTIYSSRWFLVQGISPRFLDLKKSLNLDMSWVQNTFKLISRKCNQGKVIMRMQNEVWSKQVF